MTQAVERVVGRRRSPEDLAKLTHEMNKLSFELTPQKNFTGTPEQLEMMQAFERAYIDGTPFVSDEEWDIMKNSMNYEESLVILSPSGRNWVKMFAPLVSIDKAANMEELEVFLDRFPDDEKFVLECKLDGLTANLRYRLVDRQYVLEKITSRGNGFYGLELHPNALLGVKKNWPNRIDAEHVEKIVGDTPEFFELRGEAVIKKSPEAIARYGDEAVWRNVAAGMFNRKVPYNIAGLIEMFYGKPFNKLVRTETNWIPNEISHARMFASLDITEGDTERFGKNDYVEICTDGFITVTHVGSGNKYTFQAHEESIDIVFYSCSIGDSNIDSPLIAEIPGVTHISKIDFQYPSDSELYEIGLTYKITSDRDLIRSTVTDFYGTDELGKRDSSKLRLRNLYEYAIDGVVIKPVKSNRETQGLYRKNSKRNVNKIVTPRAPEDQIAVKLLSEIIDVKLEKIEFNETSLGNVTCQGILDKPYKTESGANVQNINLHNPEWLALNDWIVEGGTYPMVMSMDIIPVLMNPANIS